MTTKTTCKHPDRPHYAHGLCRRCYMDQWDNPRRADCHVDREHYIRGQCKTCYERERSKERNKQARLQAIGALGGECICCTEDRIEFLSMHHPNNDGGEHRRKRWTKEVYDDLRDGTVEGEILCFNCHYAILYHGVCPHEKSI